MLLTKKRKWNDSDSTPDSFSHSQQPVWSTGPSPAISLQERAPGQAGGD